MPFISNWKYLKYLSRNLLIILRLKRLLNLLEDFSTLLHYFALQ